MGRVLRGCVVLVALACALPAQANDIQRHVLDASINLGWVTETLAGEGRTEANVAALSRAMAFAEAHVRAITELLRAPYQDLDFAGVLDLLSGWERVTASSGADEAAQYVSGIHQRLREVLSVFFAARTQRLVRNGNGDSHFADVGFHFGRAHIAGLRGDADAMTGHLGNMRQAIRGGLQQDQLKLCGFGVPVDWDRVPVLRGDASADGFWWSLVLIQAIALQAGRGGGSVGSVPVPLPAPVGPPPAPTPPPSATPIVPAPQHHKLFDRVAQQPSERVAGNAFPALRIETTNWDATPYAVAPSAEVTFFVGSKQRVFLAGDATGVEGWEVDDFLFVEVLQGGRQGVVQRFVIAAVEPVYFGDVALARLGELNQAAFSPSESDITAFIEPGTEARVRVHALDYGRRPGLPQRGLPHRPVATAEGDDALEGSGGVGGAVLLTAAACCRAAG